jgi:hypothetical protein
VMSSKRAIRWVSVVALCAVGALFVSGRGDRTPIVADLVKRVPNVKEALAFRGIGFKAAPGKPYESDRTAAPGRKPEETLVVRAPLRANGAFELQDGRGGKRASVKLAHASQMQTSQVEAGIVTYRDAYPDVDVVAVRDAERFELGYVARSRQLPNLEVDVAAEGAQLRIEPQTGAAVLQSENGRPKLRIEPPVAFDADGTRREGSYLLTDANTLRITLDVHDLVPPIFIDPAFFIPYWTLVEDGRAPGGATYDAQRQSRQSQIVMNGATGRPWLIRRAAPLSYLRYEEPLGTDQGVDWYSSFSGTPRTSNQTAPSAPSSLLTQDFERTAYDQSETFEWREDAWQLLPHVGLPGFIDPTLAYDGTHGKMFAFGGRLHGPTASQAAMVASVVFQNDGSGWTAKGFPGAPSARERAASAGFGSKIVLFGGRSLADPQVLLNDTWTFDGSLWKKLPISNPPPACEASQLVYDKRRERLLLIGGNCLLSTTASPETPTDYFQLWEFDGTDWMRRFEASDPTLPRSFQLRRGVAAAWHPQRQTTVLFGGLIDVTEHCPFTPADLATQRHQANINSQVFHDDTLTLQLRSQGCWGGYAHDTWEWDGTTFRQLTTTAFGGYNARHIHNTSLIPIFRQLAGNVAAPSAGSDSLAGSTTTKLWPWRYDTSTTHFAQRSALERSAATPGVPNAPALSRSGANVLSAAAAVPPAMVSPLFAPRARPQLLVQPNGKLLLFFSDDGRVYETDLTTWTDRTPTKTPFSEGRADFFAAAFDTTRQRTVLFDPVEGVTWEHDAQGWRRVTTSTSPGPWVYQFLDPWIRNLQELASYSSMFSYQARAPLMTFDRARNRSLMLHRDLLWEYDGTNWAQFGTPAALKNCKAAMLMAFDGTRSKAVVVGCNVPGQTWEWDGSAWAGPFASPFQDKIYRAGPRFKGTLQFEYTHPNALFESTTLGGVGIIDSGGTLRIWKDGTWQAGAARADDGETQAAHNYNLNRTPYVALPTAFFPPVVEDYGANRLLWFRDGIRATRELKLLPQPAAGWEDAYVGSVISGGIASQGIATVNPLPMELLPFDLVKPQAFSDPASQTDLSGNPKVVTFDGSFTNLFQPLRFLPDPVSKRIHVLTNRGVFWELGSERVYDVGETCTTSADCKDGTPCQQGVCCNSTCDGSCLTCNGAHPGTCEAMPAGSVDPKDRCGTGECAGVCSGVTQYSNGFPLSACTFTPGRTCGGGVSCSNGQVTGGGTCATNSPTCVAGPPTPVPCGGGLKCGDDAHCKPGCTSAADCQAPNQICAPDGNSCIPDGKVCHSNVECPKFNDCAPDGKRCTPDAVLVAATARGVTPSTWEPEVSRNPDQLAAYLKAQGFPTDAEGQVFVDTKSTGAMDFVFDPRKKTPVTGFRHCMDRIAQCRFETRKLDECVAGAPRCTSDTPWLDDPGGWDCCPPQCLSEFFTLRANASAADVIIQLSDGACYPHLTEYMEQP